jgi:seryl-tRNA synthetase
MNTPTLIALGTLLFGAGGLAPIVLSALIGRGGRRADEASKLMDATGDFLDRAEKTIERQERANDTLREIVVDLLDVVNEALPLVEGADPSKVDAWGSKVRRARMVDLTPRHNGFHPGGSTSGPRR